MVPFSRWRPVRYLHRWATASMRLEILCVLMGRARPQGLLRLLPRGIILHVCFYLVCRPQRYTHPSLELALRANSE